MQRWIKRPKPGESGEGENLAIDAFLAEIAEVSKKHGLTLAHEDHHGAFQVTAYYQPSIDWLMEAVDLTQL